MKTRHLVKERMLTRRRMIDACAVPVEDRASSMHFEVTISFASFFSSF